MVTVELLPVFKALKNDDDDDDDSHLPKIN